MIEAHGLFAGSHIDAVTCNCLILGVLNFVACALIRSQHASAPLHRDQRTKRGIILYTCVPLFVPDDTLVLLPVNDTDHLAGSAVRS